MESSVVEKCDSVIEFFPSTYKVLDSVTNNIQIKIVYEFNVTNEA